MTTPPGAQPGGSASLPPEIRAARRAARQGRAPRPLDARLGLLALALAILAMPFYARPSNEYQKYMTPQPPAPWSSWTRTRPRLVRLGEALPATTAPIVLTYHDISRPTPASTWSARPPSRPDGGLQAGRLPA
ncbi:hypothetical protein GXW82_25260 [Streptacidiphilus sp. 4-A2]|nr:hypothetical protein [Streptacidiphilus sp. 4-A2]